MLCTPVEHRTGYAEIIVLSRRASVDDPALAHFGFKRHKLLISASGRWSIGYSHLIRLQQRMIKFEQIRAANGVNKHRRIFGRFSAFMPSPWRLI